VIHKSHCISSLVLAICTIQPHNHDSLSILLKYTSVDLKGLLHLSPAMGDAAQKSGDLIPLQEYLQFKLAHAFAMHLPGPTTEGIPVQNILVRNLQLLRYFLSSDTVISL
jgi:hypothetical protein